MSAGGAVFGITLHPKQREVFMAPHRFRVMVAGRRFGKTKTLLAELIRAARKPRQLIWYVAPTYRMAKQIMWIELMDAIPRSWIVKSNETALEIHLVNKSRICLKGGDKPDTLRGVGINFLAMDEFQDIRSEVWDTVLRPTLTSTRGKAIFVGTPKQFNHLYELYEKGQKPGFQLKKEWKSWQFPTIMSPFIPESEIAAAKSDMDERTFRQEFEACHLPGTVIALADGSTKPIEEIRPGDALLHLVEGELRPCTVLAQGSTGEKPIVEVTLETGETFAASDRHKMKITGRTAPADAKPGEVPLNEAEALERTPLFWRPQTAQECLAALVGYNLGDGNTTANRQTYTKQDGSSSVYNFVQASFYSIVKQDMESLALDVQRSGLTETVPSVGFKKRSAKGSDSWQVQISRVPTRALVEAGVAIGKKTAQEFDVPAWVRSGTPGEKRAFLAALWGAEGNLPNPQGASAHSRLPRMPVFTMSKREGVDGAGFFNALQAMHTELGVETVVRTCKDATGTKWMLYVTAGVGNLIAFFTGVGYLYAREKQVNAWLWAQYLKIYQHTTETRVKQVQDLHASGLTQYKIAKMLGVSQGKIGVLLNRGAQRAGNDFPWIGDWLAANWNAEEQTLRVAITRKMKKPAQLVYNISVDSPDTSYVLADGWNNFNCFETMSGRVYYQFHRRTHVGNYPFNPKLPIWHGQDFNVDPMAGVILQPQENGEVWAVDEIYIPNSNTNEVVDELERRYWRQRKQITLYPDPAGAARSTKGRGESDLDIFRERGIIRIRYRRKHPPVADRVNAVNKLLRTADGIVRLKINQSCRHLIESLEQTLYKKGTSEIDKSHGLEHITDALGYPIELQFPRRDVTPKGVSF